MYLTDSKELSDLYSRAVREELKRWKRLDSGMDGLLLAFCACVAIRMDGEDPDIVLKLSEPKGQTESSA